MKVCSDCLRCYEDSAVSCVEEDHTLIEARVGGCQITDDYRLESLIEINDISETYSATNGILEQAYFVKIINQNLIGDKPDLQARFLTEARCAVAVKHPNTVRVYDSGTLPDGALYVVTEPADGQTLREFLDGVSIPEIAVINIVRQAAEGLEAIHAADIVHRNVNPENIILVPDAENNLLVKVQNIDFGGIKQQFRLSGVSDSEQTLGDLRYFSPEQCRAADEIDTLTDVYGLGITLYEMIAGQPPFDAPLAAQIIDKQISQSPPPIKISNFNIRALLTHTLMCALQKTKVGRLKSVNAFARQLRHIEQLMSHLVLPSMPQMTAENSPAKISANHASRAAENEETNISPNQLQPDTETVAAVQIKNSASVVPVVNSFLREDSATVSPLIESAPDVQIIQDFTGESKKNDALPATEQARNGQQTLADVALRDDEIKSEKSSAAKPPIEQLFVDDEEFTSGELDASKVNSAAQAEEMQAPAEAENLFDSEIAVPRIHIPNRTIFIGGAIAALFIVAILISAVLDDKFQSSPDPQTAVASGSSAAPAEKLLPKSEEPVVLNVETAFGEEPKKQPVSDEVVAADISDLPSSKTFDLRERRQLAAEKISTEKISTVTAKPSLPAQPRKEVSAAKEKPDAPTVKEKSPNKTTTIQKPFPDVKIVVGKQTPSPAKTDVLSRPRIFNKKGN